MKGPWSARSCAPRAHKARAPAVGMGLLTALLFPPEPAGAADRLVGTGQTYSSITSAISAAAAGDRILVYAGTYSANHVVNKLLQIRGVEPGVVLTATSGTVISFSGSAGGSVLGDVTVQGGNATNGGGAKVSSVSVSFERVHFLSNTSTSGGGGLFCTNANCTVLDSEFTGNTTPANGAGLMAHYGTLSVSGSLFYGNLAQTRAGGLLARQATAVSITDSVFEANFTATGSGGGASIDNTTWFTLERSTFRDNASDEFGGGMGAAGSVGTMVSNLFEGNDSIKDGGAAILAGSDVEVVNNVMRDNTAGLAAGGMYLYNATGGMVRNNLVYGNLSHLCGGGIILEYASAPVYLYNNIIAYNSADYGGGGLFLSRAGSAAELAFNTVYGNGAGSFDGVGAYDGAEIAGWNNIVAFNDGVGFDIDGVVNALAYNDSFGNTGDNYARTAAPFEGEGGNVSVDPTFIQVLLAGDPLADNPRLHPASPLVDGGDPMELDLDGSVSDPGAFGGPWGEDWSGLPIETSWTPLDVCAASDGDGDGWGDDATCPTPDCDDSTADVHPQGIETCDGLDQDCDGAIDNGFDQDLDGSLACGVAPDCVDSDPTIHPGAAELCDGVDSDCDGVWEVLDLDADGFDGIDCGGDDCDDGDATSWPGAPEVCGDGVDNDCDGGVDPTCAADCAIALDRPAEGADLTSGASFLWSGDCDGYRVEVSADPGFPADDTYYFGNIGDVAATSTFRVNSTVWAAVGRIATEVAYWRVVGGLVGEQVGSEVRSFYTTLAPMAPSPDPVAGCTVELDRPTDGTLIESAPRFMWNTNCNAAYLEISSSPDFAVEDTFYFGAVSGGRYSISTTVWDSIDSRFAANGGWWRVTAGSAEGPVSTAGNLFTVP